MNDEKNSVVIIGTGNVAWYFARVFYSSGITIKNVVGRDNNKALELAREVKSNVCSIDEIEDNSIVILCVSDDSIDSVINQLHNSILVAHTSGSVSIEEFDSKKTIGSFYPLQTLTKDVDIDSIEVPIFVESSDDQFLAKLVSLGEKISNSVRTISSEQRLHMHHAAVWINNFSNHISYQAQKITQNNDLDFQLLLPLLKETIRKIEISGAKDSQTGPARRNDIQTMQKHLNRLEGVDKETYTLLSKSIYETYKND